MTTKSQSARQTPPSREGDAPSREQRVFGPPVDIVESDDAVVLIADMPGVDQSTADVTLDKSILTIRGRVSPTEFEGYSLIYSEYHVGNYERQFTISKEIDPAGIEASVKNGVLRVTLPKTKPAAARKIEISGG